MQECKDRITIPSEDTSHKWSHFKVALQTFKINLIFPKPSRRAWAWTSRLALWPIWSWRQGKVHRYLPDLKWSPARSFFETSQILKNLKWKLFWSKTRFDMTFPHQRQLNLQRKCSPQLCPSRRHCSKPHPVLDQSWRKEPFGIKTWVRETNSSFSGVRGYFSLKGPGRLLV